MFGKHNVYVVYSLDTCFLFSRLKKAETVFEIDI